MREISKIHGNDRHPKSKSLLVWWDAVVLYAQCTIFTSQLITGVLNHYLPNYDISTHTKAMSKTSNYMIYHAIANLLDIFVKYYIFNF